MSPFQFLIVKDTVQQPAFSAPADHATAARQLGKFGISAPRRQVEWAQAWKLQQPGFDGPWFT